jgi:hypothetical protein
VKKRILSVGAAAALLAGAIAPAASASPPDKLDDARLDRAFSAYVRQHPGDWVGAQQLVESLGGSMTITGDDGTLTTPEAAAAAYDAMDGQKAGGFTTMAWPTNAFTVSVAVVTSGSTDSTVSIAGAWNFRDDFLGQGSPVDIAAILVNKSCGTWGSYSASTYRYNKTSTGRATLRSGGTGTHGPIWNVSDSISNFMSNADNGVVSAVYNRSGCSSTDKRTIQGEFVYEGNDGGSVTSVSAGWGGFNVSYSSPGQTMTRSSGAKTVPY